MRSPRELTFRLRQELQNLRLLALPPALNATAATPLPGLPDPAAVRAAVAGTPFAAGILQLADAILEHRIPLLGREIETGPTIDWRRDYVHGRSSPLRYFRFIPYLDFEAAGDHKFVWELNRHQHLVLLAQAALIGGEERYWTEAVSQIESWMVQNPFQRGVNWASALEVAFRALSWTWIYHLQGARMSAVFRRRFLRALYLHGRYIECNLSYYFSPNTHLLGEAVALHALGKLFPSFPRSERWARLGREIAHREMMRQVRDDGSHFEQSSYYHLYALDMFLFHAVLETPAAEYRERLGRMAEYLDALAGPSGNLPLLGDEDGGRFFHPFGKRTHFARATLAAAGSFLNRPELIRAKEDLLPIAAWWMECREAGGGSPQGGSRLFPDAGVAILRSGESQIVMDCGPFGDGNAAHSHSDTLSFVASRGDEEILIDPGTCSYADLKLREEFRGSSAHNTIRIGGRDQAVPDGPFRWKQPPEVAILDWKTEPGEDRLMAECRYAGFVHRRQFLFVKPDLLLILDEVNGPPGEHRIEQFWHPASEAASRRIVLSYPAETRDGWRSTAYGSKTPVPVLCVRKTVSLPCRFASAILLGELEDWKIEFNAASNVISLTNRERCVTRCVTGNPAKA